MFPRFLRCSSRVDLASSLYFNLYKVEGHWRSDRNVPAVSSFCVRKISRFAYFSCPPIPPVKAFQSFFLTPRNLLNVSRLSHVGDSTYQKVSLTFYRSFSLSSLSLSCQLSPRCTYAIPPLNRLRSSLISCTSLCQRLRFSSSSPSSRFAMATTASSSSAPRRAEKGTVQALSTEEKIGDPNFHVCKDAPFIKRRLEVFSELYEKQQKALDEKPKVPIFVELPDGSKKEGTSFVTSPFDIAMEISKGLAEASLIAKVMYSDTGVGLDSGVVAADDEEEEEEGDECCGSLQEEKKENWILWDMKRPLEGNCKLQLLKFDSDEAKHVFWHSSAHILGQAMEAEYGAQLTVGPALTCGFYYDAYLGNEFLTEASYEVIEKQALRIIKENQPFERLVCSKQDALRLFQDNPFKVQLISSKVPEAGLTTVYRCGDLIDLCRGPHLPSTGKVKAFRITKHSASYWLGKTHLDSLQRVYGVSFPDTKQLKEYLKLLEEAKKRDHRLLGSNLHLFFFDTNVSPGSCFWLPDGAKVYNKLCDFMRQEYKVRGFQEVISPNIFSCDLWKISGHYQNYKENMYLFDVEGKEWGLKPMNCPGHCIMFKHLAPSYKQLPLRLADFGVLHRNEISGSLTGLTRVRRFQQDDAHIFCRMDQIKQEVFDALSFLFFVYEQFGFSFELYLSTRPKKALGDLHLWNQAETALKEALDSIGKPWSLNPGDGAFYGPKIDIKLFDALKRSHQCGTIQLDFQLPIRFNLQYRTQDEAISNRHAVGGRGDENDGNGKGEGEEEEEEKTEGGKKKKETKRQEGEEHTNNGVVHGKEAGDEHSHHHHHHHANGVNISNHKDSEKKEEIFVEQPLRPGMARPVIIHRAILGSIERMCAVLIEHTAGKLPFWLSPRQCIVLPISDKVNDYATSVRDTLHAFGYEVGLDLSDNTVNKKIREAQLQQWNYLLVVGEKERGDKTVTVRDRADPEHQKVLSMEELIKLFESQGMPNSKKTLTLDSWKQVSQS